MSDGPEPHGPAGAIASWGVLYRPGHQHPRGSLPKRGFDRALNGTSRGRGIIRPESSISDGRMAQQGSQARGLARVPGVALPQRSRNAGQSLGHHGVLAARASDGDNGIGFCRER